VRQAVFDNFRMPFNPLFVAGPGGNPQQVRLAGMRGLIKPSGDTIELHGELPRVWTSWVLPRPTGRVRVRTLRFVPPTRLRKLVDVAHEIVVREDDCGTAEF